MSILTTESSPKRFISIVTTWRWLVSCGRVVFREIEMVDILVKCTSLFRTFIVIIWISYGYLPTNPWAKHKNNDVRRFIKRNKKFIRSKYLYWYYHSKWTSLVSLKFFELLYERYSTTTSRCCLWTIEQPFWIELPLRKGFTIPIYDVLFNSRYGKYDMYEMDYVILIHNYNISSSTKS